MRAGLLRERVTIQSENKTPDDRLGAEVAWTDFLTLACSVDDAWVRERLVASGLAAEGGTTILIRYRSDIDTTMRAVIASGPYAGTYNIRGSQVIEARGTGRAEGLALACEKGTAT